MERKINYIIKLDHIKELSEEEKKKLKKVTEKFDFRTNEYYLSLIDWTDPNDPIRKISIPSLEELEVWGKLDASNEQNYMKVKGLEHKYSDTAVVLVTNVCAMYCRFCFRKRLFINKGAEIALDISKIMEYIREHTEINNILLTGGDPLVLTTSKLEKILKELSTIPHVKIVRIGSKVPASNPHRIIDDPELLNLFEWFNTYTGKKLYLMCHFNHPKEITEVAKKAISLVQKTGTITFNQTPILKNINNNAEILKTLIENLSFIGVVPYYVFQCRPVVGNKMFSTKIEDTIDIVEKARSQVSGLAAKVRYVMSHATGKIEILGKTKEHVFFRYHRAADPENNGKFMVFKRNPEAYWFDDYTELIEEYKATA
ncbi:KamA family radical SAM protein [Thermodesulfobacterium hydrogeniphilum]|uniref:KamA family radical SAM protein n=1 Tax=Thermodesulfobacterium hydrogeniphilum TaxID=161156 RepID=UPI00056F7BF1|nr:KamA family radical SAM protein [Thermodesulfobacterium hydrogeniphilum]